MVPVSNKPADFNESKYDHRQMEKPPAIILQKSNIEQKPQPDTPVKDEKSRKQAQAGQRL